MSKPVVQASAVAHAGQATVPAEPPSLIELLAQSEAKVAKPEDVSALVDALFDGLKARLASETIGECFEHAAVEHADLQGPTTRGFIIRVLNQEKRQDDFVTATIKRKGAFPGWATALAVGFYGDESFVENWDLKLNLRMDRVQLRITLTPKFSTLQRIILVVTCAPSLEHCYVFELATCHPRTNWKAFADEGIKATRRWYKHAWRQDVGWLLDKIAEKLEVVVRDYLAATAERLSKA
jgi:hypothetical protein